MTDEQPVPDFRDLYSIDMGGTVRSLVTDRALSHNRTGRRGQVSVVLWRDGRRYRRYVSKLVKEVFG